MVPSSFRSWNEGGWQSLIGVLNTILDFNFHKIIIKNEKTQNPKFSNRRC